MLKVSNNLRAMRTFILNSFTSSVFGGNPAAVCFEENVSVLSVGFCYSKFCNLRTRNTLLPPHLQNTSNVLVNTCHSGLTNYKYLRVCFIVFIFRLKSDCPIIKPLQLLYNRRGALKILTGATLQKVPPKLYILFYISIQNIWPRGQVAGHMEALPWLKFDKVYYSYNFIILTLYMNTVLVL